MDLKECIDANEDILRTLDALIAHGLQPHNVPQEEWASLFWNYKERSFHFIRNGFDSLESRGFALDPKDFVLVDDDCDT